MMTTNKEPAWSGLLALLQRRELGWAYNAIHRIVGRKFLYNTTIWGHAQKDVL